MSPAGKGTAADTAGTTAKPRPPVEKTLEKVTPDAPGYEYAGRKFVAQKLWAPTAASPFLAAHLKSLADYPPSQGTDTLSMRKAVEEAMRKLDNVKGSSN